MMKTLLALFSWGQVMAKHLQEAALCLWYMLCADTTVADILSRRFCGRDWLEAGRSNC